MAFTLRLPENLDKEFTKIAKEVGRTKTQIIEALVDIYVKSPILPLAAAVIIKEEPSNVLKRFFNRLK